MRSSGGVFSSSPPPGGGLRFRRDGAALRESARRNLCLQQSPTPPPEQHSSSPGTEGENKTIDRTRCHCETTAGTEPGRAAVPGVLQSGVPSAASENSTVTAQHSTARCGEMGFPPQGSQRLLAALLPPVLLIALPGMSAPCGSLPPRPAPSGFIAFGGRTRGGQSGHPRKSHPGGGGDRAPFPPLSRSCRGCPRACRGNAAQRWRRGRGPPSSAGTERGLQLWEGNPLGLGLRWNPNGSRITEAHEEQPRAGGTAQRPRADALQSISLTPPRPTPAVPLPKTRQHGAGRGHSPLLPPATRPAPPHLPAAAINPIYGATCVCSAQTAAVIAAGTAVGPTLIKQPGAPDRGSPAAVPLTQPGAPGSTCVFAVPCLMPRSFHPRVALNSSFCLPGLKAWKWLRVAQRCQEERAQGAPGSAQSQCRQRWGEGRSWPPHAWLWGAGWGNR